MRGVLERLLRHHGRRRAPTVRPRLRHARGRRPRPRRRDEVCRVAGPRPRHTGAPGGHRPRGGRGRSSRRVLAESPEGPPAAPSTRSPRCSRPTASRCGAACRRRTVDEAVDGGRAIGYPVVSSRSRRCMRHQPGLTGHPGRPAHRGPAARGLRGRSTSGSPRCRPTRFVVQRMATPGVSCVVALRRGPAVRPGGVVQHRRAADRAARRHRPPHPAADRRGRLRPDLVGQGRARCCTATAARHPVHRAALADLIARVSVLADDLPEVAASCSTR